MSVADRFICPVLLISKLLPKRLFSHFMSDHAVVLIALNEEEHMVTLIG